MKTWKMIQETSIKAYRDEVKTSLGERQQAVLAELSKHHNASNNELAHHLNWPINTVTPRVNELRKAGKVRLDEKRTCAITGRTVIAWALKKDTLF